CFRHILRSSLCRIISSDLARRRRNCDFVCLAREKVEVDDSTSATLEPRRCRCSQCFLPVGTPMALLGHPTLNTVCIHDETYGTRVLLLLLRNCKRLFVNHYSAKHRIPCARYPSCLLQCD